MRRSRSSSSAAWNGRSSKCTRCTTVTRSRRGRRCSSSRARTTRSPTSRPCTSVCSPAALIAAYGGDTVLASKKFAELMDGNMRLITLVDFENDCVGTALKVARALGERLYGVRIDTSETLVDKSVIPQMGTFKPTGVNPQLVWNVRQALDAEGFRHVKIVVSGGFTVEKIRQFEEQEVPVDMYGVGSSLFQGRFDFTADVVRVEGKPLAKVGRSYRPNPRLQPVE